MSKTISSEMTFIYKFVFPVLWIGLFGLGTFAMFLGGNKEKWLFLTVLIFGTSFIAWLCLPLKRVMIDGPDLVVSNFRRSMRVPLTCIRDVTESVLINIHPVWVHFRTPTAFGPKIMFMPTVRMFAIFSSHPIVAELREAAQTGNSQRSPPPLPRALGGHSEGKS